MTSDCDGLGWGCRPKRLVPLTTRVHPPECRRKPILVVCVSGSRAALHGVTPRQGSPQGVTLQNNFKTTKTQNNEKHEAPYAYPVTRATQNSLNQVPPEKSGTASLAVLGNETSCQSTEAFHRLHARGAEEGAYNKPIGAVVTANRPVQMKRGWCHGAGSRDMAAFCRYVGLSWLGEARREYSRKIVAF